MLESLGFWIHRRRWPTLIIAGLLLAGAIALLVRGGPLSSGSIRGLEAERAQELADAVRGVRSDTTFAVVLQGRGASSNAASFDAAVESALAPLRADERVLGVVSPSPPRGGAALAMVSLNGDFEHALAAYPLVREKLASEKLEITCTGQLPFMHDLNRTLRHDLIKAELISVPVALLVLLFVFRTAVAAALPVAVGMLAVTSGIALVFFLARFIDIAQYAINVCSLIGLGVAIDYSLFMVSRYREELAHGHDYRVALSRALGSAGKVVAFSGLAVGTGLSGLLAFRGSYLFAMGVGGSVVVLLAMIFALTVLPALLAVLGPRIHRGRLPLLGFELNHGRWHRFALFVMRHPVAVLVPTLAVLVLLGAPFLRLHLAGADVRVLGRDVEARHGFELLRSHFPEQAATRIEAVVEFPSAPVTPDRASALAGLVRSIERPPHVVHVEQAADRDPARTRTALLSVFTDKPPESPSARAIVSALRDSRSVADGRLLVGGQTAADLDAVEFIRARTPHALAGVIGVTLIVLFLLLRSVLLPLKAVLMNFASIACSFGALVWVFQDGHLWITEPRPLEPSLPVLLFCILFGLSMDYEVLMLSRMKEVYERTSDNTLAVAEGLEKSAGLITSAAAIMVAVFTAFAFARVVLIQAVGVGMALAIALDATLVRTLLVPATMRLFGDLNWWAPRRLSLHARAEPRHS